MAHLITSKDINFADSVSTRLCNQWGAPYSEDIYASGRLGLVLAADTYNPSKSKFKYWAAKKIKAAIIDYFREMMGRRHQDELFKTLEFYRYEDVDWGFPELSVNGTETRVIFNDLLNKLRQQLTPAQNEYLDMRIIRGLSNIEIAEEKNEKSERVDNQFWVIRKQAKRLFVAD